MLQSLPFIQRIEIGKNQTALQTITKQKPFELFVYFQRINLAGDAEAIDKRRFSIRDISIPIEEIVLSKFPTFDDKCAPANPAHDVIEAYIRVQKSARKLNSRFGYLVKNPVQHIGGIELRAISRDNAFTVNIDGHECGPFTALRVSLAVNSRCEPIIFPVSTCFPIKL
jgi:hypothetical protein